MSIVYFEFNNWMCGRDYPDAEPFRKWMLSSPNQQFLEEDWVIKNKLVIVASIVDMSFNYCITATKDWVQLNCPELLTKYTQFLRYTKEDDELPEGQFGCPFLEYKEENIGFHLAVEKEDNCGYLCYSIED